MPMHQFPYFKHRPSALRVQQGLPVPAHCCWNGLAVIKAKPFLDGLRFRSNLQGECAASECSLLCDDLHRLGYRDIRIDPSVRVAYKAPVFRIIHQRPGSRPGYTLHSDVTNKGTQTVQKADGLAQVNHSLCCPIAPGQHHINWPVPDCHMADVMQPNYTAHFLESSTVTKHRGVVLDGGAAAGSNDMSTVTKHAGIVLGGGAAAGRSNTSTVTKQRVIVLKKGAAAGRSNTSSQT